jgi:O-antigen/teichoic acid export membrane protein
VDKNFIYYLGPSLIQTFFGIFVMVPVTTYYLDPADLGLVAILMALTMPVSPLSSTGDSWVMSSHWHRTSQDGRKELLFNLLIANLGFKLFWVIVFWAVSSTVLPVLVKEYKPEFQGYFGLALLGLLASTSWTTISSLMVMEEAAPAHALNEVLQWLAGAVTLILGLVVWQLGVMALFLSPIVVGLVSLLLGLVYVRGKFSARLSAEWMREILCRGMPAIPFSLVDVIVNSLDRVLIQWWLDLSALGIYAHAQTYRGIFVTTTKAYSRTMTPLFLDLFSTGAQEKLKGVATKVTLWYACAAAGGVFVALFSPELIHVLTHGKFDAAATLVPIWFLLVLTHSMGIPYTQFMLYVKRNSLLATSSIIVSLLTIGLMVILTKAFGIVGTAWASVLGSLGIHGVRIVLAKKLGCDYGLDRGVVWAAAVILATYVGSMLFAVPFAVKIMVAACVIISLGILLVRALGLKNAGVVIEHNS